MVCLVKAMVFPVVMYECESWTVKKAELQRIDAFELWCWRRLLRVPWTARRSNQSILKEISPGCSLEGLMLKLKLQYFDHLMQRVDSLENILMLGGIGGRIRRGRQRMRWLDWHHWLDGRESEWTPGFGEGQGGLACSDSWSRKESDTTEWLNWTDAYLLSCVELFATLCTVGFSVCGVFQARTVEWVAISFSRGSFQSRDRTHVTCISCTASRFFRNHEGSP